MFTYPKRSKLRKLVRFIAFGRLSAKVGHGIFSETQVPPKIFSPENIPHKNSYPEIVYISQKSVVVALSTVVERATMAVRTFKQSIH